MNDNPFPLIFKTTTENMAQYSLSLSLSSSLPPSPSHGSVLDLFIQGPLIEGARGNRIIN